MEKELVRQITKLKNEEHELKRILDANYPILEVRIKTFGKIKEIKKEINRLEFRLKLERKLNDANNNTDYTKK